MPAASGKRVRYRSHACCPLAGRAGGALRFWLFGLYLACYAAFTILTAFDRSLMAWAPFGGANVAVLAGFGLIGAAIALALLYWWLCRAGGPDPAAKAGR